MTKTTSPSTRIHYMNGSTVSPRVTRTFSVFVRFLAASYPDTLSWGNSRNPCDFSVANKMHVRPRFQFSLFEFLLATTAFAILFSTFSRAHRLDLELCLAGVFAFTMMFAAAICVRFRYYAAAYLAAAFACGQMFYFMAGLPFSLVVLWEAFDSPPIATSFYFGCTTLTTAFILRTWWRGEQRPTLYRGIIASYACPAVYMMVTNLGSWLNIPGGDPPEISFLCLFGFWYLTTISIYVVLPTCLLSVVLLDSVDEREHDWINELRGFGVNQ